MLVLLGFPSHGLVHHGFEHHHEILNKACVALHGMKECSACLSRQPRVRENVWDGGTTLHNVGVYGKIVV